MTTNQTIDGVSRKSLEQALKLAAVFDDGGDGADAESARGVVWILRALLEAPAPIPVPAAWMRFDHDQKAIFTRGKRSNDSEPLYPHPTAYRMPAAQLQGEPALYISRESFDDEACVGMHGTRYPTPVQDMPLYAEQPAPVAVASLEIVGRQCFPSEAMKAVQGYRKEPWVDGEVDQLPSEPGFYRVEPLVRLSDVTAPVAVVLPERVETPEDQGFGENDWALGKAFGWNACIDEAARLNTK